MQDNRRRAWRSSLVFGICALLSAQAARAADPMPFLPMGKPKYLAVDPASTPDPHAWKSWGNTSANARYSGADQITPDNVAQLKPIWKYSPPADAAAGVWQTTPLVIDGVMYITDPMDGAVALDPETGKVLWTFRVADRKLKQRGLSYWPGDKDHPARLIYGLYDRVYALDPKTGRAIPGFGGPNGYIDLREGVSDKYPDNQWQITSPPAIFDNLLIVAGATSRWAFTSQGAAVDPRAFDIRTGKLVWRFNLVPRPGQPNFGTWGPEGWKNRSGPSAWSVMAVDEKLGLVYIPVGTANAVSLGMDRPGDNLYAASVLALDARTGAYRWHFQTTHHDIWDYDLAAPPALVDLTVKGKVVPALVQVSKIGLMFILDRRTGEPVFGVEERPVPPSEIPGEIAAPTQPFPIKPAPLVPLGFKRSELSQISPESNQACNQTWDRLGMRDAEIYQPTRLYGATLIAPSNASAAGGTYGGVSFDPRLGYIIVHTRRAIGYHEVEDDGKGAIRIKGPYRQFADQMGLSCANPPWSELIAINGANGEVAWRRPLGVVDALGELGKTVGSPGNGGSLTTQSGLIFIGATYDSRFRAFDTFTGKELWVHPTPAPMTGSPITYIGKSGRQYVVLAGGRARSELNLIAFALPRPGEKTLSLEPPPEKQAAPAKAPGAPTAAKPAAKPGAAAPDRAVAKPKPVSAPLPRSVSDLAPGAGRDDFVKMCTACHDVSTAISVRRTEKGWSDVINEMRGRGAPGDDAQADRVRAYLKSIYGTGK